MRFSEGLKIEILGTLFSYFPTFSCNLGLFMQNDGLFEEKRRVVLYETTRCFYCFKGHFST